MDALRMIPDDDLFMEVMVNYHLLLPDCIDDDDDDDSGVNGALR